MTSVDAQVAGLVGACVRITRQVVPVQTTIVVLDHDLISQLEAAGVPLQKAVVPCPHATTSASGGGAPTSGGGTQSAASTSAIGELASSLAFTGAAVIPMALAGLLLLGFGVVCARRATRISGVLARG